MNANNIFTVKTAKLLFNLSHSEVIMKKQHLPTIIISSVVALVTLAVLVAGGIALFMNRGQSILDDPMYRPSPTVVAPDHETLTISGIEPYNDMSTAGAETVVEDGVIVYRNGGSSSCPPVIDNAYYDEQADQYFLTIAQYSNHACTADYRLLQQTVAHEDGTAVPEDADIILQ